MRTLVITTLMTLFFASCSLNKLETSISDVKSDGLSSETLIRYSSERITALYDNKNRKLSALAKCHNNSIKKGLLELKKIYKDHKKDHDYWNKVGICYYLGNYDNKAEFYFNHSLDISKQNKVKNPNAYNNLGVIFLKNRHYDNAYKMFHTASKENPQLLTPYYNMAQLNIQFGHIEKAERALRSLYKSASKDVDILAALATVMLIKKQYQASEGYFSKIDKDNITRPDISNHYALTLYKRGQYKKAKIVLKSQKVTTVKPVVEMRKKLTKLIDEALEKEKAKKLTAKKQ